MVGTLCLKKKGVVVLVEGDEDGFLFYMTVLTNAKKTAYTWARGEEDSCSRALSQAKAGC